MGVAIDRVHRVHDLYCGLGGWAEGFLAERYEVIGFDIERHDYGTGGYPGQLVLQDVLTIHGAQFRDADVIVASPPCQEFSYRAMPWTRAKALPPPYLGMKLFWACWRIQAEASEAAGRYIPLVVENVCGAQKWVGKAAWHYGSYYLWGDVPALMPFAQTRKVAGFRFDGSGGSFQTAAVNIAIKNSGQDWNRFSETGEVSAHWNVSAMRHLTNQRESEAVKRPGRKISEGFNNFNHGPASMSSRSAARKAASAQIAKIPFDLARWIARTYAAEWSK